MFICFADVLSVETDNSYTEDELEETDSGFEESGDDVTGGSSCAAVDEFRHDTHDVGWFVRFSGMLVFGGMVSPELSRLMMENGDLRLVWKNSLG